MRRVSRLRFGAITVLTGDNAVGKSSIVEAIAIAAGFNPEGGSRNLLGSTYDSHASLHEHLVLEWAQRAKWGWFLRAESFYNVAARFAREPELAGSATTLAELHDVSHGESFLGLVAERCTTAGLYLFDEPEAALSIQGQMKLAVLIHDAVAAGAQFVIATHSPFLMALPAARIYELDGDGPEQRAFDDVTAVGLWRRFLHDPERFYRPLLAEPDPPDKD